MNISPITWGHQCASVSSHTQVYFFHNLLHVVSSAYIHSLHPLLSHWPFLKTFAIQRMIWGPTAQTLSGAWLESQHLKSLLHLLIQNFSHKILSWFFVWEALLRLTLDFIRCYLLSKTLPESFHKAEVFSLQPMHAYLTAFCCSVAQSHPPACDPMNSSTPGFPVLHCLSEFAQTHVCWVGEAIQPSHPLSPPSPAFSLPKHQGLFLWVGSSHQVAKRLELLTALLQCFINCLMSISPP